MDRYSFFVKDFHLLHHAGFRRRFRYVPWNALEYLALPTLPFSSSLSSCFITYVPFFAVSNCVNPISLSLKVIDKMIDNRGYDIIYNII